jgi:hypothetical protein
LKENLNNIPLALQKQILIRFGYAAAVFLFFVYITIYKRSAYVSAKSGTYCFYGYQWNRTA